MTERRTPPSAGADACDVIVNNGFGEPTECGQSWPCEYHGPAATPNTERVPPAPSILEVLESHRFLESWGGRCSCGEWPNHEEGFHSEHVAARLETAQAGPPPLDASDPIAQAKFALHRYARTTEDAQDINRVIDALAARLAAAPETER